MGFCYSRSRACGLVFLACLLSGTAHAGELLHMPFACRFDGARVELLPSEDRAYEVIGPREREIHTACSPSDPDRCLSWFIHRFDIRCEGARVSWLEVAEAAAREGGRDVWVDDGRFSMRMGRFWSVARGGGPGMARRRWRRDGPFSDALDEFGTGFGDGSDRGGRIVTLPPGFAPALGVPIAFSGTSGMAQEAGITPEPSSPSANVGPSPAAPHYPAPSTYDDYADRASDRPMPEHTPPAAVDEPAQAAASDVAPEPQPVPELPERAPRREIKMAAPPTATEVATSASATRKQPEPEVKVAASEPDPAPATDAAIDGPVATSVPGNIKPVIINAPRSNSEPPETKSAPAAAAEPPAEVVQAASPEPPAAAEAPAAHASEHAKSESPPVPQLAFPIETGSMETAASDLPAEAAARASKDTGAEPMPVSLATVTVSAAAVALAALAAFGFWRWGRGEPVPAPPAERDLASVSFGYGPAGDDARKEPLLGIDQSTPAERKVAAKREAAKREANKTAEELTVPTTYEQALAALGVKADETVEAIKKIVDGLRRSCHPDHATSETDRAHRERRLRQVNVAWDLVSGKRSSTA